MHGTFISRISATRLQAIRRRTIEISYAAHRRDHRQKRTNTVIKMARLRLAEMERTFEHRYGRTLPDHDAGRDDLPLAMHHIAGTGIDVMHRCVAWAKLWAPWMPPDAARALAEKVIANPLRFKAATLGWRLGLTEAERTLLEIRTIRAIDATETPIERKRRLDRERNRRKRAEARAAKPEPVSRAKPWEAAGVSRRTWYRRKAKAGGIKPVASTSVAYTEDAICATARGGIAKGLTKAEVWSKIVLPRTKPVQIFLDNNGRYRCCLTIPPYGTMGKTGCNRAGVHGEWRMDEFIAKANIQHFKELLATERNEAKRKLLLQLLAEEEQKLAAALRRKRDEH